MAKTGERILLTESKSEVRKYFSKELKRALSRKVKERIDDIISLNEALRAPN
jgi:ribosomal protein S28E/S33